MRRHAAPAGTSNAAGQLARLPISIDRIKGAATVMNSSTKRILSTIAIAIASVAFGVIISADLGLMRNSHAQTAQIQTPQGPVVAVTIPSFADVAARVMPAVVSIRSTEIVKTSDLRKRGMGGFDPFEFFFPNPNQAPRRRGQGQGQGQDDGT